jgi:FAD/FMN-containing dehydrogenase
VTIDLSNLTELHVSSDQSYISIDPGNRWNDVYTKLESVGLGTSGGRVSTVGVGGLVTGGGISFFSRERGLVCDNVQSFEVVLGDGRIVEASQQENSDLYQALKGGSGNFGIVTRIDMTTFPFGQMWGG